ncbi:MAG: diguanylate cyclase [Desulfuromonas sp.]|nr:MAG: diguanylate cyclase [Desulfuromonas sp.]
MKICFPVESNEGMESVVYGHFGSAPLFMLFDSETKEMCEVDNFDKEHVHGSCRPLKALGGSEVDAIVVGGIGGGALIGLQRAGLKVFQSAGKTVADNIALMSVEKLDELGLEQVCGDHGHGNGHGHGCSH